MNKYRELYGYIYIYTHILVFEIFFYCLATGSSIPLDFLAIMRASRTNVASEVSLCSLRCFLMTPWLRINRFAAFVPKRATPYEKNIQYVRRKEKLLISTINTLTC